MEDNDPNRETANTWNYQSCIMSLLKHFVLLLVVLPLLAFGGGGSLKATERFGDGLNAPALVLAEVHNIAPSAAEAHLYYLDIDPLASVCGSLDPSRHGRMRRVRLWYAEGTWVGGGGAGGGVIMPATHLPKPGDVVLCVINATGDGRWYVSNEPCLFMPGSSSIIKVSGLADPALREVLARLREARAGERQVGPSAE